MSKDNSKKVQRIIKRKMALFIQNILTIIHKLKAHGPCLD